VGPGAWSLKVSEALQDSVLAFIPRAAAIFVAFALTFPWMLRLLSGFSADIVRRLPELVR
jgi:flagellar biosynthesis protein FliQ